MLWLSWFSLCSYEVEREGYRRYFLSLQGKRFGSRTLCRYPYWCGCPSLMCHSWKYTGPEKCLKPLAKINCWVMRMSLQQDYQFLTELWLDATPSITRVLVSFLWESLNSKFCFYWPSSLSHHCKVKIMSGYLKSWTTWGSWEKRLESLGIRLIAAKW